MLSTKMVFTNLFFLYYITCSALHLTKTDLKKEEDKRQTRFYQERIIILSTDRSRKKNLKLQTKQNKTK